MSKIIIKDTENFESAIRKFRRIVEQSGHLKILREKEQYEKPTAKRKRKKASAIKRNLKRLSAQKLPPKLF